MERAAYEALPRMSYTILWANFPQQTDFENFHLLHGAIQRNERHMASSTNTGNFDPAEYELWEDVAAFFESTQAISWPWKETFINVILQDISNTSHVRKSQQARILRHHGFVFKAKGKLDKIYEKPAFGYMKHYQFGVLPIGPAKPFSALHSHLKHWINRTNRGDWDHVYVARSLKHPQGISGALQCAFQGSIVLLTRPGDDEYCRPQDDSDPSKIHIMDHQFNVRPPAGWAYPVGVANLPTITSLTALANWRPEFASALRGNVKLVMRRDLL